MDGKGNLVRRGEGVKGSFYMRRSGLDDMFFGTARIAVHADGVAGQAGEESIPCLSSVGLIYSCRF